MHCRHDLLAQAGIVRGDRQGAWQAARDFLRERRPRQYAGCNIVTQLGLHHLVRQHPAALFESLAQPHQIFQVTSTRLQRAQLAAQWTQAGHRRGDDRQTWLSGVGLQMRQRLRQVDAHLQVGRQGKTRQIRSVFPQPIDPGHGCRVAPPQQHRMARCQAQCESRAPGAGAEHADVHRTFGWATTL